jgi:histidinol dehydrogenase
MKCRVVMEERYPTIEIDLIEEDHADAVHKVPPRLINALQKAQEDLERAERAIVKHVIKEEQPGAKRIEYWLAIYGD